MLKKNSMFRFFLFCSFFCFLPLKSTKSILKRMKRDDLDFSINLRISSGADYYPAKRSALVHLDKNNFSRKDFSGQDLSKEKLKGKNFRYAIFTGCTFGNASVEGANFKKAIGLTVEQKQYLRENGALNVPADDEYPIDPAENFSWFLKKSICCCKCKRKKRAVARLVPVMS